MPFALLIIGLVLVVSGVRGTTGELYDLVKGDFTGKDSFTKWVIAVLIIGSLGYVEQLRPLSRAFLVLILVTMLLANGNPKIGTGGFFEKFKKDVLQQ